jgi:glycine cleavage system aminomethyltransferase T
VAELRGAPLLVDGQVAGRVTSAERSIVLDRPIGLGWIRASSEGVFATTFEVAGDSRAQARVVPTPFYDPAGERLRG